MPPCASAPAPSCAAFSCPWRIFVPWMKCFCSLRTAAAIRCGPWSARERPGLALCGRETIRSPSAGASTALRWPVHLPPGSNVAIRCHLSTRRLWWERDTFHYFFQYGHRPLRVSDVETQKRSGGNGLRSFLLGLAAHQLKALPGKFLLLHRRPGVPGFLALCPCHVAKVEFHLQMAGQDV